MLHLTTLGGLSLSSLGSRAGASPPLVTRRHRLAVLAVLAAAGERGVSRDKLQALLWPESDAERARASLSQTLYGLRRDLGHQDVVVALGTGELGLHPDLIESDVAAFEAAARAGDWAAAVERYGGPFLDGFHLREALEFEPWVQETRARLAARHAVALERLAAAAAARGDARAAADWWRRRAGLDPLDSHAALRLMEALVAGGDPAGAVRHARAHEEAVRDELGIAPAAGVAALAGRLQRELAATPRITPAEPLPRVEERPAGPPPARADAPPAPRDAPPARELPPARRGRWLASGAGALAALLAIAAWTTGRAGEPDAPGAPNAAAVLPFRVATADSSLGFLREGMADLVAQHLTGAIGPRAVDPGAVLGAWRALTGGGRREPRAGEARALAAALGAGLVVRGEVVGTADHLVLSATMEPSTVTPADAPLEVTVEGSADSLGALVDGLVTRLLVHQAGEKRERVPGLTNRRFPALRAYLTGQAAYRGGRMEEAAAHFREALEADSGFALAAMGLVRAGEFTSTSEAWRRARDVGRVRALRERLSARDRALFDALLGARDPLERTAARELEDWRRALDVAPDAPEALYEYADRLFHMGEYLGVPGARDEARAMFERAILVDPASALPLQHLLELAAAAGDTAGVRTLERRLAAADPRHAADVAGYIRWRSAVARGDAAARREIAADLGALSTRSLRRIVGMAQLDGVGLDDADLAADALAYRADPPLLRVISVFGAHALALNRGQPSRARATLRQLRALEPITPGMLMHLFTTRQLVVTDALFGDGDPDAARAAARELALERPDHLAADPARRARQYADLCALELWRMEAGDHRTAPAAIALLRAAAARPDSSRDYGADPRLCALVLDASLAAAARRADARARLAALDSAMATGPRAFGSQFGDLVVARLAEAAGDPHAALRAVRRRRYFPMEGPVYLSSYLRAEARLAAAVGDTAGARAARERFAALRARAE